MEILEERIRRNRKKGRMKGRKTGKMGQKAKKICRNERKAVSLRAD